MSEVNKEFTFENEQYRKTYWHTCSHILAQAVKRLHPEVKLALKPAAELSPQLSAAALAEMARSAELKGMELQGRPVLLAVAPVEGTGWMLAIALDKAEALSAEDLARIVDYVRAHEEVWEVVVTGGDPLMTRVVGTGCALSAVVAAAAAMPGDRLENVAAACGLMKLAGGKAAQQGGPGSFTPAFLDALYAGGDL